MLRFFEPEMETRWPFPAATLDFHPFRAVRRDSIFPLVPPPSLESLFSSKISHAGNDGFSCAPSSNTTAGLNSLLGGSFFIDNKESDSFQLETLSPTTTGNSLSPFNLIPASETRTADLLMTPKQSIAPTTKVQDSDEIESGMREVKRQKICSYPSWSSDEAAMSPTRLAMMPARRSQKLGDRVTALQQLVSPYGKTDTASVLHEASICIKALHEQIKMLTTPYLGGERHGLLHKGVCLAPIAPTIVSLINHAELDRFTGERLATGRQFRP